MLQRNPTKIPAWAWFLLAGLATAASAQDCHDLEALELGHTEIVQADLIGAGDFEGRGRFGADSYAALPGFCRVQAVSRPGPGSAIGIEVWLPVDGWNRKIQGIGNGGWAGSIGHAAMARALANGYVAASTDTGHAGGGAEFTRDADQLADFAHRAIHEMTLAAKTVTERFYRSPHERALFAGCSTGGRQALAAAQRYPDDYDGIVAGAPAYYPSHIQGMQVYTAAVSNRSPAAILGDDELGLVNAAVIAACDRIDGVGDGVLENPLVCEFDPAALACATATSGNCLSPDQVDTVTRVYGGPTTHRGQSLFPGLARGSELGWATLSGPQPLALAEETFALLVFPGEDWDWRNFDAEADIAAAAEHIGPLLDSNDPDLSAFTDTGGKLLLYHGWNDPGIPPAGTVRYYDQVVATLGNERADASVRLFMVPGMNHCAGGTGTDQFDAVAALDEWLETGRPPERIEAARRVDGDLVRTRPLCPYPRVATYDGDGNTNDAANFSCR